MRHGSKLVLAIVAIWGLAPCFKAKAESQTVLQELQLQYESPVLIRKGDVTVTLADFVAYMDWRVPSEKQRGVLSSPSRIEGLLESIVLTNGFLRLFAFSTAADDASVQARIYQAAAREARSVYRERLREDLVLDSYEQQARELYMVEPERFVGPETINFDHILITENEDESPVSSMRRAANAYQALAEQPFKAVAEAYSDDPGFDEHGGKFTEVPIDTLVPPVREAARDIELNEYSIPIRSSFGWHIFRITSINEPRQLTWEEARPLAEEIARDRHLNQAFERRLRELNRASMQFADGAVQMILDHYGVTGFDMPIPQSGEGKDVN